MNKRTRLSTETIGIALTLWVILIVTTACTTEYRQPEDQCGDGDQLLLEEDVLTCAYRSDLIVETGFMCPERAPFQHEEMPGVVVCHGEEEIAPEDYQFIDDYLEERPDDEKDDGANDDSFDNPPNLHPYRFVMIEDTSGSPTDETPGADIDGVEIAKPGGAVFPAEAVEDFHFSSLTTNVSSDPNALLGPPDTNCDPTQTSNWYSMGGDGGYVIVGFGATRIENGDYIMVYELGVTECPDTLPHMKDDSFAVSVNFSTDVWVFIELGNCTGSCSIEVQGLTY